ncbi:MAG: hypothetical protein JXR91_02910, partial [Deltaproteobacteria bacterium]|nr:hypothetical protein [Deltaproteobacteria bacterium]
LKPINGFTNEHVKNHQKDSVVDFELIGGFRAGASFLQDSGNYKHFYAGFIPGIELKSNIFHFKKLKLGLDAGYLFYTNEKTDGTDNLKISTRYNRIDFTATFDLIFKSFFANVRSGFALTIFKTKTTDNISISASSFSHTGADPGFLLGAGLGFEFGKSVLKLKKSAFLSVNSDWVRHGNRNDFTLWCLIAYQFF